MRKQTQETMRYHNGFRRCSGANPDQSLWFPRGFLQSFLVSQASFKSAVSNPSVNQHTRWALLSRRSRPRIAAPRLAVGRSGRQPLGAGDAAVAAGEERASAAAAGMPHGRLPGLRSGRGGARMPFEIPILMPVLVESLAAGGCKHVHVLRLHCQRQDFASLHLNHAW
jgi:hypothetical protein